MNQIPSRSGAQGYVIKTQYSGTVEVLVDRDFPSSGGLVRSPDGSNGRKFEIGSWAERREQCPSKECRKTWPSNRGMSWGVGTKGAEESNQDAGVETRERVAEETKLNYRPRRRRRW
jgi:hypothetical protein